MFYDLVHSPDGIVSDVRATTRLLVDLLGLIEPREAWYQTSTCHGYDALFARVHPSRVLAPSRLEVISGHPQRSPSRAADVPAYIDEVSLAQGARPLKTHATVLTSSNVEELREHLERAGVRHRIDPPSDDLGHERLWIGFTPDGGPAYRPDDDGGIRFEVIPTQCLALPESVATGELDQVPPIDDGAMTRIVSRSYLIDDVDELLPLLETRLGWPADRVDGRPGARRASMAINFARSARFEFWEPGYDEEGSEFYSSWGAGTFATRIAVRNLGGKVQQLNDRGVGVRHLSLPGGAEEVVRVEMGTVPGFLFDFVEEDADV